MRQMSNPATSSCGACHVPVDGKSKSCTGCNTIGKAVLAAAQEMHATSAAPTT
jgi:hypothetical protein